MIRALMRPFCVLVGHDWSDPKMIDQNEAFGTSIPLYEASCRRCDATIKGDWGHLEDNHVWKHYR